MKKVLSIILAVAMMTVVLAGCGGTATVGGDKTIAVEAKGESHAFWQSVKAGAEAAGAGAGDGALGIGAVLR